MEKERRSLERRQQQQQQRQGGSNKVPKRGDTASSSLSAKSSVIASLRNSFRNRSRSRKTSAPVPISTPVSPSDGPPSIHLPTRKLSTSSAHSGRYTPTSRSGSIHSFRGNAGGWSVAARNSSAATQLLPGRAASPGRPVQVVAPFIPEEGNPEPEAAAGTSAEMRDPTLLQQQRLNGNHNNNNPVMESVQTAARTSAAPTAPARQQRCLPQTPKQASRTGLAGAASAAGASGGGRATAKVSAVVSPVQHAAAAAPSSSAAPRPAQRLSLRHKVGLGSNYGEFKGRPICEAHYEFPNIALPTSVLKVRIVSLD